MNYLDFINWKNSHVTEMQDLTFAQPNDIFIFTRFSMHQPSEFENNQVLFAGSIEEAVGYIRHIYLYDILNDAIDDLQFDFKLPFDERQKDIILLLNYWFKLGEFSSASINFKRLKDFCDIFNDDFNVREDLEYEIQIINGADELREFLINKYSKYKNFNKKRLANICSNELFVGRLLKNFLDSFFVNKL